MDDGTVVWMMGLLYGWWAGCVVDCKVGWLIGWLHGRMVIMVIIIDFSIIDSCVIMLVLGTLCCSDRHGDRVRCVRSQKGSRAR